MITDTEGIVLKQVKAVGGRRMLIIFSKKFGKISVGTSINEGRKNKSALEIKPFTYAEYELFKSKDIYNLNSGRTIRSYMGIGDDMGRFVAASYVLELTERLLPDEVPQPRLFNLLQAFLEEMETRSQKHDTLLLAFMVKALDCIGMFPELGCCSRCGKQSENSKIFSIKDGGIICPDCKNEIKNQDNEALIYDTDFDIIQILGYFKKEHLRNFKKIALDDNISKELKKILRNYLKYHLDIYNLKSEELDIL